MADQGDDGNWETAEAVAASPRRWLRGVLWFLGIVLLVLGIVWFSRERIADNLITSQLESYGIPATYKIKQIGPSTQILTDIVIGDPKRPDLTVERAEVTIRQRFGMPAVSRVRVVKPRLYGTFTQGKLSFGALDPLLFDDTNKTPFALPDFVLALEDGRGLIESDYGPLGIKVEGTGGLRDGFKGVVAAIAPKLAAQGCTTGKASLYGKLHIDDAIPHLNGPLRLESLTCAAQGVRLQNAALALDAKSNEAFTALSSDFSLRSGAGRMGQLALGGVNGTGAISLKGKALAVRYDAVMRGLNSPYAASAVLTGKGRVRGDTQSGRFNWDADWEGNGVKLGSQVDTTLAGLAQSGENTLLAPIVNRIRLALQREGRGSRLLAQTVLRKDDRGINLVMSQGNLRGGSGTSLLALSRVQYSQMDGQPVRLLGSFNTGGQNMPQITGQMEQRGGGKAVMRLAMPEYRAGGSSLAIPEMVLIQNARGGVGFAGQVRAGGALPGGQADGLVVPVTGDWSQAGGLALWRQCTDIRFNRLEVSGARFERRGLRLCPAAGSAIVRSDGRGTRIAGGASQVDLAGHLGESPIHIRSGALGFAVPGMLAARDLKVELGPQGGESRFTLKHLNARIGKDVAGRFTDADVALASVPLNILKGAGNWRFANGQLSLSQAQIEVEDRAAPGRFQRLIARDADLSLVNNVITANALLRNPESDREVVRTVIVHDLGRATGRADLTVANLVFDDKLQPDMLSDLARGVIANTKGTVTGTGRIDWNESGVTSNGRFTSSSLDFAAAFGPVQGASGTVVFTDLLGLVTAPNQQIKLAVLNPGVEVRDGVLSFEMKPGYVLDINGARWPFMDGTLTLEPTRMRLGEAEVRHYKLNVDGLDAAVFVQRMELGNIMATGKFDGTLPLVFDENGGRIAGGYLSARAPGGNVAYLGELTYKDLSPMGNFAFAALRSLDYRAMRVDMDGSLAGEILTRVSFDGISQGQGTNQNFLTKQVAKLPIRFNVNIKAPFFSLFGSFKSLYDPNLVPDPQKMGLLDKKGPAVRSAASQ